MMPGKARLALGIGCVGSLVCLAVALLETETIRTVMPTAPADPLAELVAIFGFFVIYTLVMLPFDVVGGLVIPQTGESVKVNIAAWLRHWARSVLFLGVFHTCALFCYLQIGRAVGAPLLVAFFAALQLGLLAGQELLWRLMTANSALRATAGFQSAFLVRASDRRFSGGVTGLPGLESILIPEHWPSALGKSTLHVLIERRRAALSSGARFRGVLTAMAWNTSGFAVALLLAGASVTSVSDIITVFLWFLLISFAGLLVLPGITRASVFALDQSVAATTGTGEVEEAIIAVDRITEQDTERSAAAESVFQPIPCPARRVAALHSSRASGVGSWNAARLALFLSWAFGGPLARSVHCNVGRPELWALLPVD